MQKTENISIGQRPFVCDLNAYRLIQEYLDRAEKNLKSDPDKDDIISDIEIAMAKHFEEETKGLVIDKTAAQKVIELMGEVVGLDDNLGDEESAPGNGSATNNNKSERFFRTELFKDRERGILLGVCAGIARAIHVNPFWIRAALVLIAILTYGVGSIVIYVVLGLIMRNGPSSVRTADEIIESVKEKSRNVPTWASKMEILLQSVVRFCVIVVMFFVRLALLATLIVLGSAWSIVLFFMITNPSKVVLFGDNPAVVDFIAVLSVGLVILVPLFVLITQIAGSKMARNVRFAIAVWCVWTLSFLISVGSLANAVPNIRERLIRDQPQTRNILIDAENGEIVHACFRLWGDCRTPAPVVKTVRVCDVDIQVAASSELDALQNRSWVMGYRAFEYPVDQDKYCGFIRDLRKVIPFESFVLLDIALNDEAFLYDTIFYDYLPDSQEMVPGAERKMWDATYFTRAHHD